MRRHCIRTRHGLLLDEWTALRLARRSKRFGLLFAILAEPTGRAITAASANQRDGKTCSRRPHHEMAPVFSIRRWPRAAMGGTR